MPDLFARNGSGFLRTALCVQITSRHISRGLAPFCNRGRENVMRFPSGAWLAARGTPFIHGGVSRVSLIPNTRLVKSAQPCVRNGADTCLRRFYYDVLGKSKKNFLLQLEGGHGNHKGTADVVASPALWCPSQLPSKKRRRHEKTMSAPPATTPSSACLRALLPEGQSVISSVDYRGDRLRGPAGSQPRKLSGLRLS